MIDYHEIQKSITAHMCCDLGELKKQFKMRSNEFECISVKHSQVESYEKQGYIAGEPSKQKTPMKRQKQHGQRFEDEIWCMFYKLGFRILNSDNQLVVQWGENECDTQQLDIVAVGEDAIFVVECKSAEVSRPNASFKLDITNIEHYKDGVTNVLRQLYGPNKRVKFVFATKKYRFADDSEDLARLKKNDIYHLNENSYNYINNLINSYKEAVRYQFYGMMFKDELINNYKIRIPALKGKMGSKTYYLFSIEPSTLLKIGFVLHRTRVNDAMAPTYQRLLIPSRLKGITKFIDDGGYFPNSIIINFASHSSETQVCFEPIQREELDSEAEFGVLSIPNAYGIAYIIDGQHRVYGYANTDAKFNNTIPVVAFDNMESEEQLKIFMEINENQKAVKASLRLDLEEDLYWDAERLDSRMKALRSSIIKNLAGNSNYVLYNKISVGEDNADLQFKPFDTALAHSGLVPKANNSQWKGDADVCLYNIKETNTNKAMKEAKENITRFVNGAYSIADGFMEDEYKNDFLFNARATYAFIVLVGSLHAFLIKTEVIPINAPIPDRLSAIKPYIKVLVNGLMNLSDVEVANIKGSLGQGADVFWLRSYQDIIHKEYSDFCPDGLAEWKETQDQDIQKEGLQYKEDIRNILDELVFDTLKKAYGLSWERSIATMKRECENRFWNKYSNDDNFDPNDYDWKDYMTIQDYAKLISDNFANDIVSSTFSIDVGFVPFKSRKDKLKWMSLIEMPQGKAKSALTRSDINRLVLIYQHLNNELLAD